VLAKHLSTGNSRASCGLLAFRPSISRALTAAGQNHGYECRFPTLDWLAESAERRKGRIMWYSIAYLGVLSLLLAAVYEGAVRRLRHR